MKNRRLFGPSRDGNQGREMTVAVTELESFNLASASLHSVGNSVGSDLGERGFTILLPDLYSALNRAEKASRAL